MTQLGNQFQLSQEEMDRLMQTAGQKMGTDPQKLRAQLSQGDLSGIMQQLSPNQKAQLNHFLNNPAAIQQMMENPKVQQLLKSLMGK